MLERDIHVSVVQFLGYALPSDAAFAHVPNEGKRGTQARRDFHDLGSMPGFPDLIIVWRGRAHAIELKAPRKSPTAPQKLAHAKLRAAGVPVATCHSASEVELTLISWGIPLRVSLTRTQIGRSVPAQHAELPFPVQMAV